MSWKLTNQPKTLRATRKLAHEFMIMDPPKEDRPLSERRLQVYERVMRQGHFRPVSWAKAFCVETNQWYRVNGKHTSTLISTRDGLPDLFVVVEEFHCETLEDVARLYATYDSSLQSRSVSDVNRTFASCVPELQNVCSKIINLTISAVAFSAHLDNYGKLQPAERAEAIFDNVDFAIWCEDLLGKSMAKNGHMKRMAVIAAMYLTYKKSKEAATVFWTAVRDETGAKPELPDRKIAKFLSVNHSKGATRSDRPLRYRISNHEFFVKCIRAWNAWRKNQSTDLRYSPDDSVPSVA